MPFKDTFASKLLAETFLTTVAEFKTKFEPLYFEGLVATVEVNLPEDFVIFVSSGQ